MKVLVLHTLAPVHMRAGRAANEFDLTAAAEEIARCLPNAALAAVNGSSAEILAMLDPHRPDVVFNLCEAPLGRPDLEPHVAALFEWRGMRFTGCGSETLALCRRKDRTKAVLSAAGVPLPRAGVFPCIVKPIDEDGSAGIESDSVCANAGALARATARLSGPALVEVPRRARICRFAVGARRAGVHVRRRGDLSQRPAAVHLRLQVAS